jgi:YHS domain-containing protein
MTPRFHARARRAAVLLLSALAPVGACRTAPPPEGPTAECLVCKHEGDLACVRVRVEADTPRCECGGETYYFCTEESRADFRERPERYRPTQRAGPGPRRP